MVEQTAKPVAVSLEEHKKQLDDWSLAIGRLLVAFTSCEFWTYLYVKTFGSNRQYKDATRMNLRPRTKLARKVVSNIDLVKHVQERVDAAFNKLSILARSRNLIAHNGPMVHVYQNVDTGGLEVRHELRSAIDPSKGITIAELAKQHAEAVELDEELSLLFGLVRQPENQNAKASRV